MANKKGFSQVSAYELVTICLVSNKMLDDYLAYSCVLNIEPENFAERWIKMHISRPSATFKRALWRCFITQLVDIRNRGY
jgi:hypothetical protein